MLPFLQIMLAVESHLQIIKLSKLGQIGPNWQKSSKIKIKIKTSTKNATQILEKKTI